MFIRAISERMIHLDACASKHQCNRTGSTLPRISAFVFAIILALVRPCASFQPLFGSQQHIHNVHYNRNQDNVNLQHQMTLRLHANAQARADECDSRDTNNGTGFRQINLHPRNAFQGSYDMEKLCCTYPLLSRFVRPGHDNNKNSRIDNRRRLTIDFSDADAVRTLNAALLAHDYGIHHWEEYLLPSSLIPPVPGRADYIHHIADVLASSCSMDAVILDNQQELNNTTLANANVPVGPTIRGLDIGTGASLIYPLLGSRLYGWSFLASDIDPQSQAAARRIAAAAASAVTMEHAIPVETNYDATASATTSTLPIRTNFVEIRLQKDKRRILDGIWMDDDDELDFCMCNPPFYASKEAFQKESMRKVRNLHINQNKRNKTTNKAKNGPRKVASSSSPPITVGMSSDDAGSNNFAGGASELWCPGGEVAFLLALIQESGSAVRANRCLWYSSLVSRRDHLDILLQALATNDRLLLPVAVQETRVVEMGQGQKRSSILFWTFQDKLQQKQWSIRRKWQFLKSE